MCFSQLIEDIIYKIVTKIRVMPKRKKLGILDYLDTYAFLILRGIKNGKSTYSEIMEASNLVRSNFNKRLNELINLGLISYTAGKEEGRRRTIYSLTDTGRRILELLEEIEKVYNEGVGREKEVKELVEDLKE